MRPLILHLLSSLIWIPAIYIGRWLATPTREATSSELEQSFYEYWPAYQRALYCQIVTIILGAFLLNDYVLPFLFINFGFWILPFILNMARPHPTALEKHIISAFPLVMFAAFCQLELRHGT